VDELGLLRDGELAVEGRLVVASNVTLVGEVSRSGQHRRCVYKPIAGEAPLWDFPDGSLAGREVAAYLVSEAGGWHVVPPTVMRADGPLGAGMCQLWIDQPKEPTPLVDVVAPDRVGAGSMPVLRAVDDDGAPVVLVHADHEALRRLALFDVVVNNADRKGGHVLAAGHDDPAGRSRSAVLGVDHGVTFHTDPKLRTVLWGWAGAPLDAAELDQLRNLARLLAGDLGRTLGGYLTRDEIGATVGRVQALLDAGTLPVPHGRMPVPWPVF
jgi:uncharacterized repeat protein (TIGR03843 family)